MSFLGLGGRTKMSSAEKIGMWEQEILAVADHQKRLARICQAKCIPPQYREGELNKGESVCLDRCAAKFFETQKLVGQAMQESQQAAQAQNQAAVGGGGSIF
jgi:import inner membrane translocase subunit TIM10